MDRSELFISIQNDRNNYKVLKELKDVSESLNESVEGLEDAENRRPSSGSVSFIKKGNIIGCTDRLYLFWTRL